jgi:carbon monoxide dehydrogenase subunit G
MSPRGTDWGDRASKRQPGTTVELADQVTIQRSSEEAWKYLSDVPFVASCLPGLEPSSLADLGENRFRARMVHSVMGMTANWDLEATITPFESERRLDVGLAGKDSKLGMTMKGTANVAVKDKSNTDSILDYTADIRVDGKLAAMGGPIIRSVLGDSLEGFIAAVGGEETASKSGGPRKEGVFARLLRRLGLRHS